MNILKQGIPYAVDCKRLDEQFPIDQLVEGRLIPHSELETLLDCERATPRYYGVINSWIHRIRSITGIFIVWKAGEGIEILDPAKVLCHTETQVRQKMRQTGRKIRHFSYVDRKRLDAIGQARFDHDMRVMNAFKQSIESTRKELAVALGPIQSLPKPKLVVKAS